MIFQCCEERDEKGKTSLKNIITPLRRERGYGVEQAAAVLEKSCCGFPQIKRL